MEFKVHLVIWLSTVLYSIYNMFLFTRGVDIAVSNSTGHLKNGWPLIGELRDGSDIEWESLKSFSFSVFPWIVFNFWGAELFRQQTCWQPEVWYIFVSFSFILYKFGCLSLFLLVLQPFAYILIIRLGGKSRSIWFFSCLILIMVNIWKKYYFYMANNYEYSYIMMVVGMWGHLKCLSFSLDTIHTKGKQQSRAKMNYHKILNILAYTFYLPFLLFGPFLLYSDFNKSFNIPFKTSLKRRLLAFICNITSYMGYALFIDFCLHFVYFNALQYETIVTMPDLSLYGGGYWMGLYFYLKFVVAYGMSGTFAMLDHIEPETPPRCVLRIHLYSQMWKYFDSGLHKFLKQYIYAPMMEKIKIRGRNGSTFKRFFVNMICFIFVFVWHGVEKNILVWVALNYLGIVMESLSVSISQCDFLNRLRISVLKTKPMNDRFNAFVSTPLYTMSLLSNYYFFTDYEIGNIYVQRVLNQSFNRFAIMFVCNYSACRVSQHLFSVGARKILST